jgi:hypothetical protein
MFCFNGSLNAVVTNVLTENCGEYVFDLCYLNKEGYFDKWHIYIH